MVKSEKNEKYKRLKKHLHLNISNDTHELVKKTGLNARYACADPTRPFLFYSCMGVGPEEFEPS